MRIFGASPNLLRKRRSTLFMSKVESNWGTTKSRAYGSCRTRRDLDCPTKSPRQFIDSLLRRNFDLTRSKRNTSRRKWQVDSLHDQRVGQPTYNIFLILQKPILLQGTAWDLATRCCGLPAANDLSLQYRTRAFAHPDHVQQRG